VINVALLRGINVGGGNKVAMADLRTLFTGLGFSDVATYINSGNVVFGSSSSDHLAMASSIEKAVAEQLGVPCRVLVKSGEDVRAIAEALPAEWTNDATMKADVVYLLDGADPQAAIDVLSPREGIDHAAVLPGGAFAWMVHRPNATRNGLLRMVGTPMYQQATVRNVNTARKLAGLVAQRDG
jgi:uncharacterized protein (DUF1697 family)